MMQRRNALAWMAGSAAAAPGVLLAQAGAPAAHDHNAMTKAAAARMPRRYDALVAPYQGCVQAARVCIAHCQQQLAQGDKSLAECLRTALDTDVVCNATLQLAGLNSRFTAEQARASIAVMQACVDACKEHAQHHAECKTCHDACLKAIEAARQPA
jgi:Cys-rich four helix bundle protein (predicted Tat secretion target)